MTGIVLGEGMDPKEDQAMEKSVSGKPPRNFFVIACAVLASMNSILLGYDVGVMSGAAIFIRKDLHLNDVQIEMLIGSLNIIALLGAALAGRTSDAIGRRWTMALAALIFLLGSVVMALAPSFAWLMVGRLLGGVGVGYALLIAPVYTAEVSPASSRGALTSFPEIFINVGILLGYIANYALKGLPVNLNWRVMLGLGVLAPIFLGIGVLAMPESPRWLVMRNRNDDALKVLFRTSDSRAEAHERLAGIVEGIQYAQRKADKNNPDSIPGDPLKSSGEGPWREIYKPTRPVLRMLIVALGVQFFQQAAGIDATVYYSPVIFKKAGLKSEGAILGATIAVGFAKAGFVVVAAFLIDRVGRRPLLLTSSIGSTVSLLALALALTFIGKASGAAHQVAAYVAVIAACGNVAFFSIGMGPVNWVLGSEIFPLRLRAKASSLGVAVNRTMSGVVSISFLSLTKAITVPGTFFLFMAISGLCAVFIYVLVPETKGKTLEEIVAYFHMKHSGKTSNPAELELGESQADTQTTGKLREGTEL
uniref:Major facilitator superfamily (MFS) profile domain-containing protein n=1 Tax=Araucaria cunninghamii TaxID=56994 RepID=A0A0D6R2N4_ARACU